MPPERCILKIRKEVKTEKSTEMKKFGGSSVSLVTVGIFEKWSRFDQ